MVPTELLPSPQAMPAEHTAVLPLPPGHVFPRLLEVTTVPLTVAVPSAAVHVTPLVATTFGSVMVAVFFFNDTATTEIYTLSLHDALPIFSALIVSPT